MSQNLPCPNPTCSHVFSSSVIQQAAGNALRCPVCGESFAFGPASAPGAAPRPKQAMPAHAAKRSASNTPPPTRQNGAMPGIPVPPKAPVPVAKPSAPARIATPPAPKPQLPAAPVANAAPLAKPAAAPARPVVPMAAPIMAAPLPQAPVVPSANPFADVDVVLEEPATAFAPAPPAPIPRPADLNIDVAPGDTLVQHRNLLTKTRRGWKHYAALTLGMLLFFGGIGTAAYYLIPQVRNQGGLEVPGRAFIAIVRNVKNEDEKAFRLILPETEWAPDKELKSKLNARTAWKHKSHDIWFGIAAKDYGLSKPRDAELLNEAIDRVQGLFGEAVELDAKTYPSKLGGQDGQAFKFKGQINAVVWWGECTMCSYHGFGYWMFVGAPTLEEAQQAKTYIEADGAGFAFETTRRGWREQPPRLDTFAGQKAPFTLKAAAGIWEKHDPKDEDERGELFLFGRFQKEKDNRKNATILVLAMDRGDDLKASFAAAKKYLEEKKQEESKDNRFAPMEEGGSDAPVSEDIGDRRGLMVELKLLNKEDAKRYYLLAVAMDPKHMYVFRMDSTWESRQIWRQDFKDILRTIRITGKSE